MTVLDYTPPAGDIRTLVHRHAQQWPERAFLLFPETGRSLTYGALWDKTQHYGRYFAALGLTKGDTVSFMLGNGQAAAELFLATLCNGCITSPLNPAAGQEQIEYVLEHSDTRVVFVSAAYREQVACAIEKMNRAVLLIDADVDQGPDWQMQPATTAPDPQLDGSDSGLLMYTSGTTGRPKGVMLSHRNLLAGGMNTARAHELSGQDRALCVLPLCHINAQCVTVMAPLVTAGSVVMPHAFSVSMFWSWVIDQRCSWFSVVPTIISYLMHHEHPAGDAELRQALAGVRFGRSASAALPPALHAGFEEKFGVAIVETMGLTETAAQVLANPMPPKRNKYGSSGLAFGTEVRIVDRQGNTLGQDEEGELMIRGDCVMAGYYKNPQATAEALEADGWLHTGDLARQDADGFVFITGRLKELIIKGGENIAPREIDDALYAHPAVIEAGAIGIDDEHYGQEVVACVKVDPQSGVTEQELIAFCLGKLGRVKTPKNIYFLKELPKGPSGKVQRLKLVDQLKSGQVI
ncbi:AMP-binding protein [Marinobacterium rhizophilum]|uniref:AMP-binding protein n=1 Tax=Marinobacterium rhizophilum TaxID=420402 RepID=A0ABY5HGQ5_9GAMM|nr:AMP-binding protein [Marinobacterium rhizophilum]UTW11551.1 AMP-binding protein [Marinobacterium rhizophilum]